MNDDICIIIQGPTEKEHVKKIKECWSDFKLIFSTWVDSDKSAYDLENDIVIFNEYPEIPEWVVSHPLIGNWHYQQKSSLEGFKLAKKMGIKRVLKWMSDFLVSDSKNFVKLFDSEKLNFWAFITKSGGYLADFFMEGNVDIMISIFETDKAGEFPERIITNRVYELNLHNKINLIMDHLGKHTDVFWIKHNYWLFQNIGLETYSSVFGRVT